MGADFLVYLCAIFVVSREKNILKRTCIKSYFAWQSKEAIVFLWGICVGGGIHLTVSCLSLFTHWLPCAAVFPWAMSGAEQRLMLSRVTCSRRSSAGTWEPWQQDPPRVWVFPCWRGGFCNSPSVAACLKWIGDSFLQRQERLLFLVVTWWQMVFLSLYAYKCLKKCFRNRGLLRWIWTLKNAFV